MRVEIRGVIDYGILDSERVVLDILEDSNIGHYMLLDTSYTHHNKPSRKIQHTYKFQNQQVKEGDIVILYTKAGKDSIQQNSYAITYSFYWNLDSCVWGNADDCALIVHFDSFMHKKVVETTQLKPKKYRLGINNLKLSNKQILLK